MKMEVIIVIITVAAITKCVNSDTTEETPTEIQLLALENLSNQAFKVSQTDYVPATVDSIEGNPNLKSLWVYRPSSNYLSHPKSDDGNLVTSKVLKSPHSISRLAKTLNFGFDPYFNKDYFEPFERRPRPVTLVTFKKHGYIPRTTAEMQSGRSNEVAEIQSHFYDATNKFEEDKGMP